MVIREAISIIRRFLLRPLEKDTMAALFLYYVFTFFIVCGACFSGEMKTLNQGCSLRRRPKNKKVDHSRSGRRNAGFQKRKSYRPAQSPSDFSTSVINPAENWFFSAVERGRRIRRCERASGSIFRLGAKIEAILRTAFNIFTAWFYGLYAIRAVKSNQLVLGRRVRKIRVALLFPGRDDFYCWK